MNEKLLPQTTYKDKPPLAVQDSFRLNRELSDYLFGNCDHGHGGYSNHLACRWCVLECFAAIETKITTARKEESEAVWAKALEAAHAHLNAGSSGSADYVSGFASGVISGARQTIVAIEAAASTKGANDG